MVPQVGSAASGYGGVAAAARVNILYEFVGVYVFESVVPAAAGGVFILKKKSTLEIFYFLQIYTLIVFLVLRNVCFGNPLKITQIVY